MASRALIMVVCLLVGGCQASWPEPRAVSRGFQPEGRVVAPYEDGKLHLAAGRYGLAIDRFGQALAHDRRSLDALNGLAIAYARLGRFDLARVHFDRALEIDAFSTLTLNNYGRALIEQGRLQDATPFLELARERASQAELTVVAANLESLRRARPPALIAALRGERTAVSEDRRLIRLASNRYRLETPEPSPHQPRPAIASPSPIAPDAALEAGQRPAHAEAHARVPLGLAAADGTLGRALAAATGLGTAALQPDKLVIEPRVTGSRTAILSATWARGAAAASALTIGERT